MAGSVKLRSLPIGFPAGDAWGRNAFRPYILSNGTLGPAMRTARGEGASGGAAYTAALADISPQIAGATSTELASVIVYDVHLLFIAGKAVGTQYEVLLFWALSAGDAMGNPDGTVTMV